MALDAFALVPTVGFVPNLFPRDPLSFNYFQEHMAIGQIVESLVSADRNGNIIPGIAEFWKVENAGKLIYFTLKSNYLFSNGKKLSVKDVIYSLERHRTNSQSQSYPLLNNVSSIEAVSENIIALHLKEPQIAIFKILSRDQLGIVPEGWTFSMKSDEPFIGTGPYRLVREKNDWFLIKNERYHSPSDIKIEKWKLLFLKNKDSTHLPDYFPLATASECEFYNKMAGTNINQTQKHAQDQTPDQQIQIREFLSFIQNSAWWYPHGPHYENQNHKKTKMSAIRRLFELRSQHLNFKRATGIIPFGVGGYLPDAVTFSPIGKTEIDRLSKEDPQLRVVRVIVRSNLFDEIFSSQDTQTVEEQMGIQFVVIKSPLNSREERIAQKADIIIDRWAGGFNDPEGFLPIVKDVIDQPLNVYLGPLYPKFQAASHELNWSVRTEKFRDFNRDLVLQQRMVPGWKTPIYSVLRSPLKEVTAFFRYTPRLIDIGWKSCDGCH